MIAYFCRSCQADLSNSKRSIFQPQDATFGTAAIHKFLQRWVTCLFSSTFQIIMQNPILIIGPGMCGFQAMVDLLNLQRDCSIFCQAPPLLPWDRPDGFHLQSRIDMLAKKSRRTFFGDAGSSYLPHLKEVLSAAPQAKIVCLQRPLDEVVPKFKTHLSRDYPCKVNHWSFSLEGNATWDPYWSRC